MALLIDLKPHEKVLVGNTLITNDKQKTRLRIEGDAPILREKDTMSDESADTPAKKLYLIIQNIYLAPGAEAMNEFNNYFNQLRSILTIAPHVESFLNQISAHLIQGTYYKALKLVQDLINCEESGETPSTLNPKEPSNRNKMEAQLLNQAANQLEEVQSNFDTLTTDEIDNVISYNRKLWMAFFDGVNDNNSSPQKSTEQFNLLNNIVNLYQFIYSSSTDIVKKKDENKIQSLIDINRATATALLSN
jgi:flagellar protein FlbT